MSNILPNPLTKEQLENKRALVSSELFKQPVINGVDANVYFQTDEVGTFSYMDNIFTIQLTSSQTAYPVYNNTQFQPNSVYTTKEALAGIIVYSQSILDVYGQLELKRMNGQNLYVLPQIIIEFIDRNKYTYEHAPQYNINSVVKFNKVYLTYPQISITPDSSPIQLISRFLTNSYEVLVG